MTATTSQTTVMQALSALPDPMTVTLTERTLLRVGARPRIQVEISGGSYGAAEPDPCATCGHKAYRPFRAATFRWRDGKFHYATSEVDVAGETWTRRKRHDSIADALRRLDRAWPS